MDAHLKERLIGAVVLVVLGVWLIPWVLDGPDVKMSILGATFRIFSHVCSLVTK